MKAERSFSRDTEMVKGWLDVTRNRLVRYYILSYLTLIVTEGTHGTTQHSVARTILEDPDLNKIEADWLASSIASVLLGSYIKEGNYVNF